MSTTAPGTRHLAFIVQRGVTRCMTCCARVGPTWQDKARRLWLLIVSDKQEALVPAVEHLNLIHAHELAKASGQ